MSTQQIVIKGDVLSEGIYRLSVVKNGISGSALNRYRFIEKIKSPRRNRQDRLKIKQNSFVIKGKEQEVFLNGNISTIQQETIFSLKLSKGERFYGLGDQTRSRLEQSGSRAVMKIENVNSYIPIPFIMSRATVFL